MTEQVQNKKHLLWQLKADVVQSAAHPLRVGIIECLSQGPQCVCDIAEYVNSERSNVSRHLAVMLKSGILQARKHRQNMIYSISTPCIVSFLNCVNEFLKQHSQNENAILSQLK